MSRVEPERNKYVGHRYVPKIFGEWDKQNEYEGLSIVTHQGTSYTSKKRVPVGIDILNEEFWVVTGNYDAQIEYYRQDVANLKNGFNDFKTDTNDKINDFKTEVNNKQDNFETVTNQKIDDFKTETKEIIYESGISVKEYGAIGDGTPHPLSDFYTTLSDAQQDYDFVTSLNSEIDYAGIQKCINENAGKLPIIIPHGVFMISDTIKLPTKEIYERHNSMVRILGVGKASNYKDTVLSQKYSGSTLYATNKDVTVLSTADKVIPPTDQPWTYQHGWSRDIYISTLNIIGRQAVTMDWDNPNETNKYSVGLNLDGVHSTEINDVSCEGFGQGIRAEDCIVSFTGSTRVASNYRGIEATRSSNINECIVKFNNLNALSNIINVSLDNCRVFNMLSGGIQSAETHTEKGTPGVMIKNSFELDAHISNATLESNRSADDVQPLIMIDDSGIDVLNIDKSNITSMVNSKLIETQGYFNAINVNGNIFHGSIKKFHDSIQVTEYNPVVDINISENPETQRLKSMDLNMNGNSPVEFNNRVKSNYNIMNHDFLPKDFKKVNLLENVDKTVRYISEPFNTERYNYSIENVLTGKSRLYFINDETTYGTNMVDVYLSDSRGKNPIDDVNIFTVSILVDTNSGEQVPFVYDIYDKDSRRFTYFSPDNFTQSMVHSGTVISDNNTVFDKYIITVKLNNNDGKFNKGLKFIRLANFKGGSAYSGVEFIKVYAPTKNNHKENRFFGSSTPGVKGGMWEVGDRILNNTPTIDGTYEWVCIESGMGGTWRSLK